MQPRSGGKNEKWSGTSDESRLGDYAWYEKNAGGVEEIGMGLYPMNAHERARKEVGKKKANGLGLFDMSGNVWELCADWHDREYYAKSPDVDPVGPPPSWSLSSYHAFRGGDLNSAPRRLRVAYRGDPPDLAHGDLGFRLALPVQRP